MSTVANVPPPEGADTYTFTVLIPTYNRAHTLPRALASIEAQTFRDFEVVIVDDGSKDNTKELVEQWHAGVDFPVTYLHQENQGKHVAHNTGIAKARGFFTVVLDSDDALTDHALEIFWEHWQRIPEGLRRNFAGVEGLCAHFDGRIHGSRYPEDVMDSNHIEMQRRYHLRGDQKNALRSDLLRQFPYPVFEGERHIRPSLLWKRIALKYKTRYVNEVVQKIEQLPGGLASNRFRLRMRNPKGFRQYFLEEINSHSAGAPLRELVGDYLKYIRYSLLAKIPLGRQVRDIKSPLLWLLMLPLGTLKWLDDHRRMRKESGKN